MTIALVVEFEVESTGAEEFAKLLCEKAKLSCKIEEGCLRCDVIQDAERKTSFGLYELFSDIGAVQTHLNSLHVREFQRQASKHQFSRRSRGFSVLFPPNKLTLV